MPAVQHWGRKESIIWPPRGYIYTIGAFFVALGASALLMYVHFERGFTPLQKYYLPYYVRTELAGQLHPADAYQLLYIADRRSLRRLALENDVEPGVTPQGAGRPLPLRLAYQEAKNESFLLVRGPLARYSNKLLHAWLGSSVYGGEPVYKQFVSQLWVGVVVFSFPFISLHEKSPGFDERKMDDLIVPSIPPRTDTEEIQGNLLFPEQTAQPAEHQME